MQKQPTAGRPYKSRFGGGYINGNQYLAENMCARLARRNHIELSERFWQSKRWDSEFKLQTIHAGKLLKEFSMEAIIAALRSTRGKQIYSLGFRSKLVPLIQDEQERLDRKKVVAEVKAQAEPKPEPEPTLVAPEQPRPNFVAKPTTLSKLRGLE